MKLSQVRFLEQEMKIVSPVTGQVTSFKANSHQEQIFDAINQNSRVVITQARQVGVTTALLCELLIQALAVPNSTVMLCSVNSALSRASRDFAECLYRTMTPSRVPTLLRNNSNEMTFDNGSRIMFNTVNVNAVLAISLDMLVIDNADYCPKVELDNLLNVVYHPSTIAKVIMSCNNYHAIPKTNLVKYTNLSLYKNNAIGAVIQTVDISDSPEDNYDRAMSIL